MVKIKPWAQDKTPTESDASRIMASEGLHPYRWSNSPGYVYGAHAHPFHKVVYVVEGSITFGLPQESQEMTLQAGDRLDLPEKTVHDAVVGPRGVVWLEARRP
jgi:quercetin dioxygenase-like cupin family protein